MTHASLTLWLLGFIGGCVAIMTVIFWSLAAHLHQTLRQFNALLPDVQQAVRAAGRLAQRTDRVFTRLDVATQALERALHRGYGVAAEALERVASFAQQTRQAWKERFGISNGTGAEPRRHRRSA